MKHRLVLVMALLAAASVSTAQTPSISGLSPSNAVAGGSEFQMTVTGVGFVSGATVWWNNTQLPTTFVPGTLAPPALRATVSASLIVQPGFAQITVLLPSGFRTAPVNFFINTPPPSILSINPNEVIAGSQDVTIRVLGTGFVTGSTVYWGDFFPLTTTLLSPTILSATIPAALITTPGVRQVFVGNPNESQSNIVSFTVRAANPVLLSIQPSQTLAGGPTFTLIATGSNFQSGESGGLVVVWNQTPLSTSFSPNQGSLQASVPASLITQPGNASITVRNPDGGVSNPLNFQITAPSLQITSLSPSSAASGGPQFTLTVTGSGFSTGTAVVWGETTLTTVVQNASSLQAVVPASLIAQPGSVSVRARSTAGAISNSLTFQITAAPLQISSLSPSSTVAGGAAFTLTVTGSGFTSGTTVVWNESTLSTQFVGSTTLQATVPASFIAQPGTASVAARATSGGLSNSLPFQITAPLLQITSLAPSTATAGGPQFTMTVTGSGFDSGTVVVWNESTLTTMALSATTLQATVPASFIAQAGTASVRARGFSGTLSNSLSFQIIGTSLQITSLNPSSATAGGPAFTLTVTGNGFLLGAVVLFNGTALSTTSETSTTLQATVPASLIAQAGIATVAVRNHTGATSNSVQFLIETGLRITALSPSSAAAGGPQFTMTVLGSGFNAASLSGGSVVRWNGGALQTTFVNSGELQAVVPPNLIEQAGTAQVTVENTGRGTSNALLFTVTSLLRITALDPTTRIAGGPAFPLAVDGTGFVSGSAIRFNGIVVPTFFAGPTRLQTTVPASLIVVPGTVNIDVVSPQGFPSNSLPFTIISGPVIVRLSPSSVPAGGPAFTLSVVGRGFDGDSVVMWDGTALATEHINDGQLNATVPANLIAQQRTATITVQNPEQATSLGFPFQVTGALRINTLTPSSATAGGPAFTLTVDGTGFYETSRVLWGGIQLPTTFVSSTRLAASVAATRIAQAGTVNVSVEIPNIGTSNSLPFTVQAALSITSLQPSTAVAVPPRPTSSGPPFVLTVLGTGFVSTSVVQWNGSALATSFLSATHLTASVPEALIPEPGSASVTVLNPGGLQSNALSFTITAPLRLTSLSPSSTVAGGSAFVLTVDGSGFAGGAVVRWNFTPLTTSVVSSTRLTATVPANLISQAGTATITVANPDGAVTPGLNFTVTPSLGITNLDPTSAVAGASSVALTVNGSGFVTGAVVQWGGVPLPTTFVSNTRLTATIPGDLIADPVTGRIRVVNPNGIISNIVDLPVRLPPVPAVAFRGAPANADPNDSIQVGANLGGPFPAAISGRYTVTFEPNSVGPFTDDPRNVQFSNGTRTFEFTLPPNQMQLPPVDLKAGTVAGTIVLTASLAGAAGSQMETPVTTTTRIQVGRLAPRIDRACLARTATGFDAVVIGYSTPRQITGATFRFNASAGANLQTTQLAPADIGTAFTTWYQSAASQTNGLGSQFRLVQPFTIAGASDAVSNVTVVLTNGVGQSQSATASFEDGCPNR